MICQVTPDELLLADMLPAFCPPPQVDSWEWICEHGRMPNGVPFDGDKIPWCKGVCAAFDDPETREIDLQWGTRLGKTTISIQLMGKAAAVHPRPGLFTTSTQKLSERTVSNKIYPVLDAIHETAKQLPSMRFRKMTEIPLTGSPIYVAWSGSDTMLADLSAFYGFGNEVDKWSMIERASGDAGEGDALAQFFERFKEFYNYKIILECSPSTKANSRIEKRRLLGNNCRYEVPCPRCGGHQALRLGKEGEPGGIWWDRKPDGTSDPMIARNTARYVCLHCRYEIGNSERPKMMRRGVWVPEGCHVDKRGRVRGTPARGPRIWSSQLSSLYSLQLNWGDVAEKFIQDNKSTASLRTFQNCWLAETFEPFKTKSEPEQIGERLTVDLARGVIPKWATHLFAAVDRQETHWVYLIVACGPRQEEHVVAHGTLDTLAELESEVIRKTFEHEDGGEPMCPCLTVIDCGFQTKTIYEFCSKFKKTTHKVLPIKGANTDLAGEPYTRKIIGIDEGKSARTKKILIRKGFGLIRIRVNPFYYEPIIADQLEYLSPGEAGALTFHSECRNDLDFLRQLCNGAESEEPSKTDPDRHLWVKRWKSEANDYRDCKRYARCGMDYHFKRNWMNAENRQGPKQAASQRTVVESKEEPVRGRDRHRARERFRFSRQSERRRRR